MASDHEILQAALIGYQVEIDRIDKLMADIRAQIGGRVPEASDSAFSPPEAEHRPRRKMSAAARKRIAAAQKKRWAEYHKLIKGS